MILEEVLLVVMVPGLVGWVLWLLYRRYQLQSRARIKQLETFDHLVEKLSTMRELADFMQTEAGQKLFQDRTTGPPDPLASIRRFAQSGLILVVLGGAFLVNAARIGDETDLNFVSQATTLNDWGTIFIASGLAFLIIAVVSYRLHKSRP